MKVEIKDLDWYQAWVVSADFGLPESYLVYMEMFNLASKNFFFEKHLRKPAAVALDHRNLRALGDLSEKAEAAAKMNVKLANHPSDLLPHHNIPTNTGIDWKKIDAKLVAFKFANNLLHDMLNNTFGDYLRDATSPFVNHIEVDLGVQCVISAGVHAGVGSTIKIGAERISKLNARNQVSFKVSHCGGI